MHQVGREYALQHHVTLSTLQHFIPRSSNPNCSAGFGMGLVMALGPEIIRTGGRAGLAECRRQPTRYRSYTCVHGLGHALMRGYHGNLELAVKSCRALGPWAGPDCAVGAFHDYWISLRGGDGTTKLENVETSPRVVCNGHLTYVRPCWFRYFLEDPVAPPMQAPSNLRRACAGLHRLQRSGCVSAAAATIAGTPFDQTRFCARLAGDDAASCVRGVAVQALVGKPAAQLRLLRSCDVMRGRVALDGCYSWFGRTLNVLTNGAFRSLGCPQLASVSARASCVAGARLWNLPLLTFS